MKYNQKKIVDEWRKLFPKITSTEEFLTIEIRKGIAKIPIPKQTSIVNNKNINYR